MRRMSEVRFSFADFIEQTLRGLIAFAYRFPVTMFACVFFPTRIVRGLVRPNTAVHFVRPFTFLCIGTLATYLSQTQFNASLSPWDRRSQGAVRGFFTTLDPASLLIDVVPVVLCAVLLGWVIGFVMMCLKRGTPWYDRAFGRRTRIIVKLAAYATGVVGLAFGIMTYLLAWCASRPVELPILTAVGQLAFKYASVTGVLLLLSGVPIIHQAWRIALGKASSNKNLWVRIVISAAFLIGSLFSLGVGIEWLKAQGDDQGVGVQAILLASHINEEEDYREFSIDVVIANDKGQMLVIKKQCRLDWHAKGAEESSSVLPKIKVVQIDEGVLETEGYWIIPAGKKLVIRVVHLAHFQQVLLPSPGDVVELEFTARDEGTDDYSIRRRLRVLMSD